MEHHNPRRSSKKKGSLEETLSYAFYKDDPRKFRVFYRDKDKIKEANLKYFFEEEEYGAIPLTRIILVSRLDKPVWKKGQKEVLVKD